MNRDLPAMLEEVLSRGLRAIVLTNAMRPMRKCRPALLALRERYGDRLTIRVSVDHYGAAVHEAERGRRSWQPTIDGLKWLPITGFRSTSPAATSPASRRRAMRQRVRPAVRRNRHRARRRRPGRVDDLSRDGPDRRRAGNHRGVLGHPQQIAGQRDVREPRAWWSSARARHRRASSPAPCCPTTRNWISGRALPAATGAVPLNHPHCAKFCVLGGAACSRE